MSSQPESFVLSRISSPIGTILLVTDGQAVLRMLDWEDHEERMREMLQRYYERAVLSDGPTPEGISNRLDRYFAGELSALSEIPVAMPGTRFQRDVWEALRTIPAGTTLSYGVLAQKIGRPSAVRAVGAANGANPIGVVVPCHRVIGADASLTGYGGGLERKRWLLRHEGARFK